MCVRASVPEAQQTETAPPEHQEPLHSSQDSRGSTQQQWTPRGSHENLAEERRVNRTINIRTYCMHVQKPCCVQFICTRVIQAVT